MDNELMKRIVELLNRMKPLIGLGLPLSQINILREQIARMVREIEEMPAEEPAPMEVKKKRGQK